MKTTIPPEIAQMDSNLPLIGIILIAAYFIIRYLYENWEHPKKITKNKNTCSKKLKQF